MGTRKKLGSGNIFADLGLPNTGERQLRAALAGRELHPRDVDEFQRRWKAGKAGCLAGEIGIRDVIADDKTKKAR